MTKDLDKIVRKASQLMISSGFAVSHKEGYANIVTSSDLAVQNFLKEELGKLLPDSGFLCEEEDRHQLGRDYTWIIDPIDGTANYARGIDQCAISVGLKHGNNIVEGIVYMPRTDEMFTAIKGEGAYLNGKRIHVSDRSFQDSVMCTALPVYHKEHSALCSRIIEDTFCQCNDIRRFGAAAPELCYLAMGRIELYFEYLLSPWDYAAASLIVTEAGGSVCNREGNAPSFTEPSGIIAANTVDNMHRLQQIIAKHAKNDN